MARIPVKLCFNEEIHRISSLPDNTKALLDLAQHFFKHKLPTDWTLQYQDSDKDLIMLTDDQDLKHLKEEIASSPSSLTSIKIFVLPLNNTNSTEAKALSNEPKNSDCQQEEKEEPKEKIPPHLEELLKKRQEANNSFIPPPPSNIHENIQCNGCGIVPIVGIRYHCSVCEDFDYCEECEARCSSNHQHVFMKIRKPDVVKSCPYRHLAQ